MWSCLTLVLANVKGKYTVNFFRKNITNVGHKNLANKKPPIKGGTF